MNAEISLFGVFAPSLLLCAIVAYLISAAISRMLGAVGFYRLVWHRPLFNFAMFVCLLGACEILLSKVSP
jgi:Protein of unknown function (DUF1656)